MNQSSVIKINIDEVLRQRLPHHYRFIPRFLIRWLEIIICQDQLNELLSNNYGKKDADFCRGVINDLNISLKINGKDNLPPREKRRVVIVSNHPLGGLDGIALIDFINQQYGGKLHFVVNDLLMAVKPLNGVFLPINKHGKQSRLSMQAIEDAFAGDDPILIFPAGLVSRQGENGVIADLKWQKMFVAKSIKYHRDIIPLYFDGENSPFFYNFAKLRAKLNIKFNIEMILLPREIFRCKNSTLTISIGAPISWQSLVCKENHDLQLIANDIKRFVYNLNQI